MNSYKLPLQVAQAEFTEKRSRFIAYITPIASENEAIEFLQSIRKMHREATHNVYAYRLYENSIMRHSDEGEPSGTAGMPLLDVFIKQDIFDFCCVATRYFGGVQLGSGGLVRAYSRCGVIALEASGIGIMQEMADCELSIPYGSYEPLKRLLLAHGAEITSEDFGLEVKLLFTIPKQDLADLQAQVTEQTSGEHEVGIRN